MSRSLCDNPWIGSLLWRVLNKGKPLWQSLNRKPLWWVLNEKKPLWQSLNRKALWRPTKGSLCGNLWKESLRGELCRMQGKLWRNARRTLKERNGKYGKPWKNVTYGELGRNNSVRNVTMKSCIVLRSKQEKLDAPEYVANSEYELKELEEQIC